jgi:hypothetical protein
MRGSSGTAPAVLLLLKVRHHSGTRVKSPTNSEL